MSMTKRNSSPMDQLSSEIQSQPQSAKSPKIRFIVWFTEALNKYKGLKVHHMTPIRDYFVENGLGDPHEPESYDEALEAYGYKKGE